MRQRLGSEAAATACRAVHAQLTCGGAEAHDFGYFIHCRSSSAEVTPAECAEGQGSSPDPACRTCCR